MLKELDRQTPDNVPKIEEIVNFPVWYHLPAGKIYDQKNREVATVKSIYTDDVRRLVLGDFICEAMNGASKQK